MARKTLLDSIDIPAPCQKSWDEMIGDAKTRFCGSCEKNIYNISEMTRAEVRKLLFQSKEKVCIRLEKGADGKVQTFKKQFHKITRQAPIAAGVLSASLAFSALTYAQGNAEIGTTSATISTKLQNKKTSQISFTIFDITGAIVPNQTVELTNQKTKEEFAVSTNVRGVAQFSLIPHGKYDLNVSGNGFNTYQGIIRIKEQIEPNIKITLSAGTAVGDFVVNWSEIPLFQAIAQNDNETVKQQIINTDFDVNTKDKSGETALHVAVQHGNLEIIQFLLEKGAKTTVKDKSKLTPLAMIFSSFEDDEAVLKKIIRLLVSKGADINMRTGKENDNRTLLMAAAEDNNVEWVKFLLELGANPNLKDDEGETAMQKTDSDGIKQLLKKYGAQK